MADLISRARPIIFRPELVLEILAGRKTVTRRPVKGLPDPADNVRLIGGYVKCAAPTQEHEASRRIPCPYGWIGDRLWVRETLRLSVERGVWVYDADGSPVTVRRDDHEAVLAMRAWAHHKESTTCVSIHMPRWACRLELDVIGVRVERLHDITEEQARAEGVMPFPYDPEGDCWTDGKCRTAFEHKWRTLYGWGDEPLSWKANPWVWVISFARGRLDAAV